MLTGIIDLVTQQPDALTYRRVWRWRDRNALEGEGRYDGPRRNPGDEEIWDFKATKAKTHYLSDYVRQVDHLRGLYRERSGRLPSVPAYFFVNEGNKGRDS